MRNLPRLDCRTRATNLAGIYNKPCFEDGRTVTADENYGRESILNPTAKIVNGFSRSCPPFKACSDEQLTRWSPT